MNINERLVCPLEYSDALTFSGFPRLLNWAVSNWESCPVGGEDEYLYWAAHYANLLSTPYMASLGAILTLLADAFLEYDRARGVITEEQKAWWFTAWQGMILKALAQCDLFDMRKKAFLRQDQDIVTVTKTFNV